MGKATAEDTESGFPEEDEALPTESEHPEAEFLRMLLF